MLLFYTIIGMSYISEESNGTVPFGGLVTRSDCM